MRSASFVRTLGVVTLAFLLVAMPVAAEPGGPVLEYLQTTIKPLLDTIQASGTAVQSAVAAVQTTVTQLLTKTTSVESTVNAQPTLHVTRRVVTTTAGTTSGANLDVWSEPPSTGFGKTRRYTVSMKILGGLDALPPGSSLVRVVNGVSDPDRTVSYQVDVLRHDPAVGGGDITVRPYAGTNSFISVTRGADGLGPIDVVVNAYIESEP